MYAVEFSHRSGRDLINLAKKRTNIIPVIEDARHPHKYRMLIGEGSRRSRAARTSHSRIPGRTSGAWIQMQLGYMSRPLESAGMERGQGAR